MSLFLVLTTLCRGWASSFCYAGFMKWAKPPLNKVYEALGALGDERVEVEGNSAKVYSSSRNKYYDVTYDPERNLISSNDNASYFVGYLGYPAIALLLAKGVVGYDPRLAEYLKGFAWKDINQKFKNDFDRTNNYIDEQIEKKYGIDMNDFHNQIERILDKVVHLQLEKSTARKKPPQGY
jgi:hypothetical protein